jgi:hypothetical protein
VERTATTSSLYCSFLALALPEKNWHVGSIRPINRTEPFTPSQTGQVALTLVPRRFAFNLTVVATHAPSSVICPSAIVNVVAGMVTMPARMASPSTR